MNQPETMVYEMCNGFVQANPELEFLNKYKIIKKKVMNPEKVTLISGGGSGHEPAHAGFVGKGMLDAAVCGDIFASPSQIQVYQALRETKSKKGTLLIIKNYSGDIMNFRNGAHLAGEDGINVDYIKVEDDIAVKDSLYTVGRRGVAGTVFVHKIAGAAAELGLELNAVKRVAQKAADYVKSIGFALSSCTVPAKGTPTFKLGEDEMEYGVGIHGEPGICREPVKSADEIALRMSEALLKELEITGNDNSEVAVLVNGFGASPLQELYLLNNAVTRILTEKGVTVHRSFVGNYMTSIDMAGASLSFLKLDDELKKLLSFESEASAFPVKGPVEPVNYKSCMPKLLSVDKVCYQVETDASDAIIHENQVSLENIIYLVDKMSEVIIRNEVPFCELDAHAGDGDFGMSVSKGFRQLKREFKVIRKENTSSIGDFLQACSIVIMEHCGGASGPIWGSAFRAAGKATIGKNELTAEEFALMLQSAVKGIQLTGERCFGRGASIGDKTLMDALIPCANTWSQHACKGESILPLFAMGADAAKEGAKTTELIVARMGRAGTVGERSIGYPDAGAYALGVIFTELANAIKQEQERRYA